MRCSQFAPPGSGPRCYGQSSRAGAMLLLGRQQHSDSVSGICARLTDARSAHLSIHPHPHPTPRARTATRPAKHADQHLMRARAETGDGRQRSDDPLHENLAMPPAEPTGRLLCGDSGQNGTSMLRVRGSPPVRTCRPGSRRLTSEPRRRTRGKGIHTTRCRVAAS